MRVTPFNRPAELRRSTEALAQPGPGLGTARFLGRGELPGFGQRPTWLASCWHGSVKVRNWVVVGSRVACATAAVTAILGVAEDANALSCAVPGGGISRGTDILVHCPLCAAQGAPATVATVWNGTLGIAVKEVARVEMANGGLAFRYLANEDLAGESYTLDGSLQSLSTQPSPHDGVPDVPVATLTGYGMDDGVWGSSRLAYFALEGVTGMLVADEGEPDEDPMSNLVDTYQAPDETSFTFGLGFGPCGGSLPSAELGVETRVRFGAMAPNGDFSGWTAWLDLAYPNSLGVYEVNEQGEVTLQQAPPEPEPEGSDGGGDTENVDGAEPDAPIGEPSGNDEASPSDAPASNDESIAQNRIDEDEAGPSNCSTTLAGSPAGGAGWALVLLGLVGLARSRRSADCLMSQR